MITWKREAGVPQGVDVRYSGVSEYLVEYEVHSVTNGPERGFYAYRKHGRRLVPAAEGGAHKALWAAQGCAEHDLQQVLASRGPRILIRPRTLPISRLFELGASGFRWESRSIEACALDEPLIDQAYFDGGEAVCPCGAFAVAVEPLTYADLREALQTHIDDKHKGR